MDISEYVVADESSVPFLSCIFYHSDIEIYLKHWVKTAYTFAVLFCLYHLSIYVIIVSHIHIHVFKYNDKKYKIYRSDKTVE